MGATLTMPLDEYETLRRAVQEAEKENAALRAQLEKVNLSADDAVPKLATALNAALPIVQFAIANLDPDTVRGWPYETLRTLADTLQTVPGISAQTREAWIEFKKFASEAENRETERRTRPRAVAPATEGDWGPQTDEAKAVDAHYRGHR
jgi:hypothetical protein